MTAQETGKPQTGKRLRRRRAPSPSPSRPTTGEKIDRTVTSALRDTLELATPIWPLILLIGVPKAFPDPYPFSADAGLVWWSVNMIAVATVCGTLYLWLRFYPKDRYMQNVIAIGMLFCFLIALIGGKSFLLNHINAQLGSPQTVLGVVHKVGRSCVTTTNARRADTRTECGDYIVVQPEPPSPERYWRIYARTDVPLASLHKGNRLAIRTHASIFGVSVAGITVLPDTR